MEVNRIVITSKGCIANASIDGVKLHGITELSVEYGVGKIPTVHLGIAAPELVVDATAVEYKMSELLLHEIEEAKKLMELSANNPINIP